MQGPGVTIGRSGASIGVATYTEQDYWPLNTTLFVKDFLGNHPRYIFYLFRTIDFAGYNSGSAQPSLNRNYIAQLPLRVPSLAGQIAIAEVLAALDDKIDVNRGLSNLLELEVAALFEHCDFDNAQGDAVVLSDLVDVNPPRPRPSTDSAPYIDMAALPTSSALVANPDHRAPKSGARFVNGDTVMARITPCLENGKIAFVDCLPEGTTGIGSTEFIVLSPKPNLPSHFAYFLARSRRFAGYAVRHMSGSSGRQRCPADALERYEIRIPDGRKLLTFADLAAPAFERMRAALNESVILEQLRDTLLPKLLSGEVRVREAESAVEAAV